MVFDRSVKKGEHFDTHLEGKVDLKGVAGDVDELKLPSIWISLAPIVTFYCHYLDFFSVANIILVALAAAIVVSYSIPQLYSITEYDLECGRQEQLCRPFSTSSSVAFGSVLTFGTWFLTSNKRYLYSW